MLANGLGRYQEAVVAAGQAAEHPHHPSPGNWGLSELIEAAVRTGQPKLAADALARLEPITRAAGTDWALGIQARARALLSDDETAEPLYREAIERLGRTRIRAELLVRICSTASGFAGPAGGWMRASSCEPPTSGSRGIGADAFAERARRELLATGESVRRLTSETRDVLTSQEAQIARLAVAGLTNAEIGTRLFISPRTVEYHLRKVFGKLGVSTRRELRGALAETFVGA